MSGLKTIDGVEYADLSELRARYDHLLYLRKQKRLIEEAINAVEEELRAKITDAGADGGVIDGLPVVTYKQDGTFPHAKYAAVNPHIAAQCQETKTVFSVDRLKHLFPEEYKLWRPRSFKIVTRGTR